MKRYIQKFAAVLGAGAMLANMAAIPSAASEDESIPDITLPSGMALDEFIHEMDDLLKEMITDSKDPSAAIAVFSGDETVYERYYGNADIAAGLHADEDTVYEWGSITKTFTWVSVMQLWEQGRIDLDRDIREYLPEGFFQHLAYDDPITMTDLMNHRGGWGETTGMLFVDDDSELLPLKDALQKIEPAQTYRPDEITAYSNYGAAVAGYIVEQVSGMDYCDYVKQNIFEPLGMEHTAIAPDYSDNQWVREQRAKLKSYKISFSNTPYEVGTKWNYVTIYPAGSATGTLGDLVRFAKSLTDEDAPLFKNKETQQTMLSGSFFYGGSDIPECCHGFWPQECSVRIFGHNGGTLACSSDMEFDPVSGTGYVVLQNHRSNTEVMGLMMKNVFGELEPDKYGKASGTADVSGNLVLARSLHSGLLKFYGDLNTFSLPGKCEDLGGGLLQLRIPGADNTETAMMLGLTECGGNMIVQTPSNDAIKDSAYFAKLLLFTGYLFTSLISLYALLIKHKLLKHGRYKKFRGSSVMTASEILKILSLLTLIITGGQYLKHNGISETGMVILGSVQIVCMAVFAVSAVCSAVLAAANRQTKVISACYIANTAGNALCLATMVFFEMYKFRG